ncbi:MAG: adenylate/guanylate cyclase domain-containing protein [Deltaproteobacteria bacterium]|nr:adenylate/guanylate cyclase domain-containing protein [Deltaproteobacteria bacterium]
MRRFYLLALGFTLFALLLSFVRPHPFEVMERKFYDLHFTLRGPLNPTDQVVIVSIDEKSLEALGRWPWPRGLLARLFEKLVDQGAKVIVPDIFFSEPSGNPEDILLSRTLRRYPEIVVGYFFLMTDEEMKEKGIEQREDPLSFENIRQSTLKNIPPWPHLKEAIGLQGVLPLFADLPGGERQGFFNFLNDTDGTVRQTSLVIRYRDHFFPSLSLQAALTVLGDDGPSWLQKLPLTPQGEFLINFRGNGFSRISAVDLLKGENRSLSLKGKVVLVGAMAAGLEDNRPTPLDPLMASTLLQANTIDNLLREDFLRRDRVTDRLSWLLILIPAFVLGLLIPRLRPIADFFIFLGVLLAQWGVIHFLFVQKGLVLQNIYPFFSTVLSYGGLSLYDYLVQEKKKRFISETFEHYLSRDVIRELSDHPEKIRLGGERKELTVFFADIRNFTSLVEATPPEVLVEFLNSYLTPATDLILERKGLLDKYIGDAVMAVFGSPLPVVDHAERACDSAAALIRLVREKGKIWQRQFQIPLLRVGVGLNTGVVTAGNIGSTHRFDYTVLGDSVNLASRLEALNKVYGTSILVGPATYEKAKERFPFREIDEVQVRGKKEWVRIYELLVDPPSEVLRLLPLYQEALATFREGRLAPAKALFQRCLQEVPEDGPSQFFVQRCA